MVSQHDPWLFRTGWTIKSWGLKFFQRMHAYLTGRFIYNLQRMGALTWFKPGAGAGAGGWELGRRAHSAGPGREGKAWNKKPSSIVERCSRKGARVRMVRGEAVGHPFSRCERTWTRTISDLYSHVTINFCSGAFGEICGSSIAIDTSRITKQQSAHWWCVIYVKRTSRVRGEDRRRRWWRTQWGKKTRFSLSSGFDCQKPEMLSRNGSDNEGKKGAFWSSNARSSMRI